MLYRQSFITRKIKVFRVHVLTRSSESPVDGAPKFDMCCPRAPSAKSTDQSEASRSRDHFPKVYKEFTFFPSGSFEPGLRLRHTTRSRFPDGVTVNGISTK